MRIAVDARELQGRPTGVGRYLAGILDAWATLPAASAHNFILCAPGPVDSTLARGGRASTIVTGGSGTWWEQRALPRLIRRTNADVLFAPGYTAPLLCPAPVVVAIHDVSFAAHPEWFAWREGLRRRTLTRLSALRAARVVTISEFSKHEIAGRLRIKPSKIDVIYPGAPHLLVDRAQPGPAQTILYAGSLFSRRHIPELIAGFARLARKRTDVRLEIVGDNRTAPRIDIAGLAAATGAGGRIALRSYLPEDQLAAPYGRARAFVFLSEYEGFGLTPLEALGAGIPIVVLDTPVAREVYGSAALYVERPEPALIETALERILGDEAERARILAAARDTLARYSWRTCAEQVLEVLVVCSRCRASR
ncbi:MAG: glycosyltransferase family 4 protein [Acidobacteria bacterium]|nr:glycosyltransferase family 4 protein [Acidobacteriota bacterium]